MYIRRVWHHRAYRTGQVWEFGMTLFLVLDNVDWDIRVSFSDSENDLLRIVFLQVGHGDGCFSYLYKDGDVSMFHRCSVVVEHARMVA